MKHPRVIKDRTETSSSSIGRLITSLSSSSTMRSSFRRRPAVAATLLSVILLAATATRISWAASRHSPQPPPPVSFQSGINKRLSARWNQAANLAALEQQVEDYNADWIAGSRSKGEAVKHRRLICLPLDEGFDPPPGIFSHKHVQTGDKMSLPACFWDAIQLNRAEVPWLFRVKRIDGVTAPRVQYNSNSNNNNSTSNHPLDDAIVTEYQPLAELDQVVGGPLDCRAPSNYVFLPLWMMRALGIRPRDVVEVELTETVAPGSLARLRPHSKEFAQDISNPQAVMETELRHYSSLTQGSTIAFDYNKKRYWFDVVELRSAPKGERVPFVKAQDCDLATDFLTSKDILLEQKKKKRERQRQKELQEL